MDINTTFWFFDKVRNDKLCLLYNGSFSDEVTDKFIDLSEYNINTNVELSKMKKKVSFLMAECFQNIVRHGETKEVNKDTYENPGFFLTKSIDSSYFITTGNLIYKKNIDKLKGQLNQVNNLDKDELKELYRKVIDTEEFSSKGGAGLGLIEMARKSGQKIEFSFNEYDEVFSFFYSQITLMRKNEELEPIEKIDFPIIESIDFHKKMNEKNILLIQKGDFSQESILPVLNIIEQNLRSDSSIPNKNKEVYHVLVELLQNIGKHCLKIDERNDGIFLIGQKESNFVVTAGNYIENSKVPDLEKRLKTVQTLSKNELKELYLKELKEGKETEHGGAGIGLIDIAKECTNPIKYNFYKIDQNKQFFTIQVSI